MQIRSFSVSKYRSIYDLEVRLKHINVVTGANGCGKSNLFNAFRLVKETILGRLNERLVAEGGLGSVFWAGPRKVAPNQRIGLHVVSDDFEYEVEFGFQPQLLPANKPPWDVPVPPMFPMDPMVKKEVIKLGGRVMVDRGSRSAMLQKMSGEQVKHPEIIETLSIFAQIENAEDYPYLQAIRQAAERWVLYHEFRTDESSPARALSADTYPRRFASDGSNLGASLYLINEIGNYDALVDRVKEALPESDLSIDRIHFKMLHQGLMRPTEPHELSDGTLKFLCLAAACYHPHPPQLMFFNEPEASLNSAAIAPLARMLEYASMSSQIWVTTHSTELAQHLQRMPEVKFLPLEKNDGETVLVGGSRRGKYFLEED